MKTTIKVFIKRLLNRFPRLKRLAQTLLSFVVPSRGVSAQYVEMGKDSFDQESIRLGNAWKNDNLPQRQRKLVDSQLKEYKAGAPLAVFDVLVQSIQNLPKLPRQASVLEVGCSSGYYSEVLQIAGLNVQYSGCDFSEAFVGMARALYPKNAFQVEDATRLTYEDQSFDVVVSGCCLLHIPDYPKAVAETARVARHYAIFHRTPMVIGQPNQYYRKKAYDVETVEIHFNEPEFLELLELNGLEVIETHTLDESIEHGKGSATRTWVCRKKDQ